MARYFGVTNDLERRKAEHERCAGAKGIRNWTVANDGAPFPARAAAQVWLFSHGEHEQLAAVPSRGPFYGYWFDFER